MSYFWHGIEEKESVEKTEIVSPVVPFNPCKLKRLRVRFDSEGGSENFYKL